MKDILLQHGGHYIMSEINGLELTLTYSDDLRRHEVFTLRNSDSYYAMKQELNDVYEEGGCSLDSYDSAIMGMQTVDFHEEYFTDELGYSYCDIRDREEIEEYCTEAVDKVWLMRTHPCHEHPNVEARRVKAVERIVSTYSDIPKNGYSDWECGYWNGIMGALRWVLGDEKDFLDT